MIDLFVLEKSPRSSSIPSIQSASGTTQVHTQHTPKNATTKKTTLFRTLLLLPKVSSTSP